MRSEVVRFHGINFRRYPESTNWADRSYFTPPIYARKRGVGRLHEEVWIEANGPIPAGYDIHHADGNSLNNDLSNLVCLSIQEHQAIHTAERREHGLYRAPGAEAREAAVEWHRSEDGRAWHRRQARDTWAQREPQTHMCRQCGREYQTTKIGRGVLFCSNNCRAANRRASGADNETRTCPACGRAFSVNRYSKSESCGRVCAQRLRRERAASRL